ncbi:MAG: hypothetical protein IKX43_08005 [Paludibacteraceae bacterium]|nr:hypothetical protein [Paludibacteraceae bacterium]
MKEIILTLDYELYGNGQGDIFRQIVEPTDRILKIAKRHNAHLTIFLEVVEYWRLKEEWERGNTMGYTGNPISAMEKQIREAVREGHDVQLHLHPQWVNARWTEEGWVVDPTSHRLSHYEGEGENSLVGLLRRGIETLERLITPVKPYYRCQAFRAGGFNAQPSEAIVKAMLEVGLKLDSSLFPGGFAQGSISSYDYRSLPKDRGIWNVADRLDLPTEEATGLYELPVCSLDITRWRKYASLDRVKNILCNTKKSKEMYVAKVSQMNDGEKKLGVMDKIRFMLGKECQTWDFCLLPEAVHDQFIDEMARQNDRQYFTLVGHPKSYLGDQGFSALLKTLNDNNYRFATIQKILSDLENK